MPYKDIEKDREWHKKWMKNHPKQTIKWELERQERRKKTGYYETEEFKIKRYEYRQKIKKKALEILGGKCVYCGCDIPEALEMNHINGGGRKEKRINPHYTTKIYADIIAGRRTDIELTCRVCNALHYLVKLKGLPNRWKIIFEDDKQIID